MVRYEDDVLWNRHLYDRWPLVVQLSDRVDVERFRQVPPISELGENDIGVSGIGTMAAARVVPLSRPEEAFVVMSMYARWMKPHPSTCSPWRAGASDVSAHRILSDLSAFIGHEDPSRHRILAAGDLNMIYGATGRRLSLPERPAHRLGPLRSARLEVSRTSSAGRPPGCGGAARCTAGHAECSDLLSYRKVCGRCRGPARLRLRFARFPRTDEGTAHSTRSTSGDRATIAGC